jgi:hypothetical protein
VDHRVAVDDDDVVGSLRDAWPDERDHRKQQRQQPNRLCACASTPPASLHFTSIKAHHPKEAVVAVGNL